mgnify:CR=1 FL=1
MSTHEDQSGEPVHEKKTGVLISLRNNFFTGIIIALPIAVTVWLLTWFIRLVDDRVLSVVPPEFNPNIWIKEATGFSIPGIGLVIAVVALWMLGVLASNFIGTSVIRFGERLLGRVPLVSNIYNALKQIVTTMAQQKDRAFKDVCLIEYPRPGLWAIGFVTSDLKGAPLEYLEEDYICVFVPTTPNPTSGFLLFTERKDVKILNMTPEEGAKMIISGGMVASNEDLKVLADEKPKRTRPAKK